MNIEDKTETTAQGSDAYATYDSQGNLIVGKDNQVSPIQQDPKTGNARVDSKPENVVLGTRNGVGKFTHSTETKKPISGDASYAYEKLDTEWITVKVYNPDTHSYDDKQVEVYKLTPGQYMDDEYNVRAKYPERSYYSTDEDYRKAVEVYNNVATYYGQDRNRRSYYVSGATAVGVDNVAEGDHSTAIGNKAKVLNSVSSYYVDASGKLTSNQADAHFWLDEQGNITNSRQGYYASDGTFVDRYYMVPRLIDSSDAVAIGSDVTAEGRSAVAIGHQSYAKEYSVSIGENSVTDYMGVAIGKDNKAKYASTAIGHTNDANGYYTAALGVNNTAHGDESTAIGYGNSVDGQQQNGGTTPKAYFTHVLGSNNTVKGSYNAVFGDTNTVTGAYALALGGHNKISGENTNDADGDYGIAIGYGNNVEKNALALGLNSNSIHDGSIAIGNQVNRTGDNNNGATDTIAIGTKASVHMKNGIVLGNEAYAGNNGNNSEGAIAIGHQARSAAGESIAIGTQATTGNNVGSTGMTNIGAIAIGSNSTADTVYDIAMGWGANTKNTANGGAIALGHNATIEQGGQASAAIGDSARVKENLHDAVALGSQSYADRAANNQGGYDPVSNSKNHNAGSDPVWNSTLAAVSVGSSDHYVWDGTKNIHYAQQTRQITNVAAGKEDTDAVNVAQLKQVVNLVNTGGGSGTGGSGVHDYSVKSVDSTKDSNYNNAGATGNNALAAGVSASATGENAVAIGTGAEAEGKGATVIGQYASATGDYATAFGGEQTDTTAAAANNMASGKNAVAFWERTTASGANATAFGLETTASEKRATAFGQRTTAKQSNATAFGQDALADGQNATAFGNLTVASNYGATAFGNKNKATGQYATAWGGGDKVIGKDANDKDIKQGTVASGTYATAFGERTEASGESATAFGSDSTASGINSLAFGENSTAAGENSVAALGGTTAQNAANAAAIGKDAQAKLADSVALGSGSVADRQSGTKGYDAATGAESTQTSATWVANANAIAVGNGSNLTRQITGVAAGSDDTDAVNLAQLKEVGKLANKHTTVSVGNNKADADDSLVKGGNLELKRHTTDGQANYDVALSKDVVLGEQEEHKGGSLVVNSVAQFRKAPGSKETYPVREAVKIDGTTVSVVKNDGTNDQRQVVLGVGQDTGGYVALFDNTGKTPTYIFNAISSGITYLKDGNEYPANEANEFKRLEYGDITNGSTQFIATLDDGLKFGGDQGTPSAVKLNQKLTVTGGETNPDNLVTANNIGVVSSQDGDNGKLELKLNKDLTGLNTVTAGTAKIGYHADGVLDAVQDGKPTGGHAKGGDYVTGLTNKEWTVDAPTYVSGRAATEDELRIVSDAVSGNTTTIENNTRIINRNTDAINSGLSFTTNTKDAANTTENYKGYKVVKRSLGDTIAIKASDETGGHSYSTSNLTTRIAENGDISILMDEKPSFTMVTTGDVIYTGNPDRKDKDGKAAQADTSVHYGDKTLTDGKNITTSDNETKSTRLGYQDAQGLRHDIATMDDGQIYAGDIKADGTADNAGFSRTLNQKTTINGGVTNKDNLTDNNIGVVSNGTDTLTVKLAKELKDLTSVTTGKTVQNDSGIKITNSTTDVTKNVVINGDKISFGGNQVTNMGSGADGTADGKPDGTPTYNTLTNGANIGDVKNIAGSTTDAAKLTGDSNITVTYNDSTADGKNTVKLNDSITLGSDADKKVTIDGTKGTITAGDKVSLDGSTGKGTIGGVTIGNQTGVTTTKMDGDKAKTEDGTFVTGLSNKTWNPDSNGIVSGRAATEDQLKTVSDTVNAGWELDVNGGKQKDVTPTSRKVNFKQGQNITISGSGDDVTVETADNVRFASVRVGGDADGKGGYIGGIVIGQQSGLKADGKPSANPNVDYYITGLKNTNWDSEKIQSGRAATEDQLKIVADEIKNGTVTGDVFVTGGGIKYNGEHDASDTTSVNDGKGNLKLTLRNQDELLSIDGLHDYYAASGTVSADGKTLTIARNEQDAEGKPVTFDVDLTNLLNKEKHLIANPADGSQGVYKVNEQGEVTLQVQDAAGNNTPVTISGLDGVKGLNFDANTKKTSDGKVHNVKLGGTIKVQGVDPVTGHDYSADNVTTEVDDNGNITIKLDKALTADTVMVTGKDGKDGQLGTPGHIGIDGKDGQSGIGIDGKDGISIKGQNGKDGVTLKGIDGKDGVDGAEGHIGLNGKDGMVDIWTKPGKPGVDGETMTRIVYKNPDGQEHQGATLDDGLKFHGDSGDVVTRKLNTQLDVLGGQTDTAKLTATTDGNIGVVSTKAADETSNGKLEIRLAKELKGLTSVQTGDTTVDGNGLTINKAGNGGKDSITINKTTVSIAGNQITNMGSGLGNTYTVAGDNNGANIGDVKNIADGRRTTVRSTDGSVNVVDQNANNPDATSHDYDLSVDTTKVAGAVDLKYKGDNNTQGSNKLSEAVTFSGTANQIVTEATDGKVTFKLADDLTTQTITATGKNGNDGQIGLTGKDGADGSVTTIIKTVGAKGTDGKDGIPGVDGQPDKDGITRLIYQDVKDGESGTTTHVVATLDDGLKFVGNDGKVVARKLNDILSLKGGIDDPEVLADKSRVSRRNLGVRQNTAGDGLEIVMTSRPDFEAITVGPDSSQAHKITIGKQDNQPGNPNPTKGNYIQGLDNTQWDAGHVVADRAATEGQLSQAITDISGKEKGGFGLADEEGNTVKKELGGTITVKGDGKNIETKVNGDALEVSLKKDVDLGQEGSLNAGNTTINNDGVETNKVKVGDITITQDGINGGAKQITNIASGLDSTKHYADPIDNNAASIGDVKQIAGEEAGKAAEAVKSKSGKNITVKDDHTVNLNDNITLGDDQDKTKQVAIDGNGAKVTAGDGANKVTMDGSKGQVTIGTGDNAMTLGKQANTAGDSNPEKGNYLNGLDNKKWDGKNIQKGRAATEDQLKTVSDKVNGGRVFQGDDGQNVTVGLGDALKIQGGAKDVSSDNNIGIVKGADDTLNVRLAKDLTGLTSVTTGNTTINNSELTVKTGDSNRNITVQDGNVDMGGNQIHNVAPGTAPTDAVNVSQLQQTGRAINQLGSSLDKLGTRVDRVGANSAALAALHPLDFDPDDKLDFAVGAGNYSGANAVALGAFYRPNEDVMFSLGGSTGGGENMVNIGATFKLGQHNHVSNSRVAMAKEIRDLKQLVAKQEGEMQQLKTLMNQMAGRTVMKVDKDALFPDIPENHWAYDYVTKLAKAGIVEGYEDGEFKGNRMMTRYEFAAVIYRAIMAGAGSNPALDQDGTLGKLVKEFDGELKYIRIDVIEKDKHGNPTIERVRTVEDSEKHHGK